MKQNSSNQKSSHDSQRDSNQLPAAGPNGLAITPPAHEMSSILSIQRKADPSAGGDGQGSSSPNRTGLPDTLKNGIEALSGFSLDDVRVHTNSSKPAQLQALAYAQGTDIHLGPGQERHLPHEAWHVVQQKQGRVKPSFTKNSVTINNDIKLESEADEKAKLAQSHLVSHTEPFNQPAQISDVVQRKVGFEFQTNIGAGVRGKGVSIFEATNWHMEGDQNELEFITDAFSEEGPRPQVEPMLKAVGEIAEIASTIDSIGKSTGMSEERIPLSKFSKYGKPIPYKGNEVSLGIDSWALVGVSASPQVTGGVSLGKIGQLMDKVISTQLPVNELITEGVPFEEPTQRNPKAGTAAGAGFARYEKIYAEAQSLATWETLEARAEIELMEENLDQDELGEPPIPVTQEEWDRVEGFLTYVFSYILLGNAQTKTLNQTKYLFGLMSRTSFSAMFNALPQEYRVLGYFPAEILERTKLNDGYLLKEGLKFGSDPLYRGPTRLEWLTSIEEGRDLLSSALSDSPMVAERDFGSPAMGKYPELEKDVKDGVLIEIRSLPEEVTPEYWVPMAFKLFKMFRDVQKS